MYWIVRCPKNYTICVLSDIGGTIDVSAELEDMKNDYGRHIDTQDECPDINFCHNTKNCMFCDKQKWVRG